MKLPLVEITLTIELLALKPKSKTPGLASVISWSHRLMVLVEREGCNQDSSNP